jgi:hypothetical protein
MTLQANPSLGPEASSDPEILPRKSPQLVKTQEQVGLINVCSSVCSVIITTAHLKATQPTTSHMPPPPLPLGGVQVETAFWEGKGKGKAVVKGKAQDGGDGQDGFDECDDEDINDPSYKDNHDLCAQLIVQKVS